MNLLFDFAVNRETNTITITREFEADLDLVWDAFTDAKILDQWMGPKPWRLETKEMDFREGGRWLYAMISPDNVANYSLAQFITIDPKTKFITKNSFSDENGNPGQMGFTFSITENHFTPGEGKTTVKIIKQMEDLAQLEKFVALGFKEGMAVVLKALDELLASMKSRGVKS